MILWHIPVHLILDFASPKSIVPVFQVRSIKKTDMMDPVQKASLTGLVSEVLLGLAKSNPFFGGNVPVFMGTYGTPPPKATPPKK